MPKSVIQYDLLISCPGDIHNEIEILKRIVDNFNRQYTGILGISLNLKHWSKDSYAQSGNKPQKILNEQFVYECDAAIAIFWTRFGTETDEYGSGTEEEIEYMLDNDKQVFMYFSDKPVSPSLHEPIQYEKINRFRERYSNRGLYSTYRDDNQFEQLVTAHLAKYFLSLQAVEEVTQNTRVSKLTIKCISGNTVKENIVVEPFTVNTIITGDSILAAIIDKYDELKRIPLKKQCHLVRLNSI